MGLDVLFWIVVLTWMVKRGTEDVTYAVKGQTPPRHRERMERIKRGDSQARYGVRGWLDDATEDFLRANTQWRRSQAAKKAAARLDVPLDDLADAVREPKRHPHDPNNTRNCPTCKGEVVLDGRPCPRCLAEQQRRNVEWEEGMQPIGDYEKPTCVRCRATYAQPGSANCPACDHAEGNYPDDRPTARLYQFPHVTQIEKEIDMFNAEVTGLSTAITYARDVVKAHESYSTSGAERYVGVLEQGGNGPEVIGSAREAMEASQIAAARWAAHKEVLEQQMTVREAYQAQPDAGNKDFVVNE